MSEMTDKKIVRTSKFLSLILRHEQERVSVKLGGAGPVACAGTIHRVPNMSPNKLLVLLVTFVAAVLSTGCRSVRQAHSADGSQMRIVTYNLNWGAPEPGTAAAIIKKTRADIVCLQETSIEWEKHLRALLADEYPSMDFRSSKGRMGGGLGFLSKRPIKEIAYIPSDTGWFDGWIAAFDTDIGTIQILNVHLHPQVGERGTFTVSGYLTSGRKRKAEIQRFCANLLPALPTIVAGDFNDTDHSAPVEWLKQQGFTDALPEFDRRSVTWEWKVGPIHLRRRFDHIPYRGDLSCCAADVIHAGASDHFPVAAVFEEKVNEGRK
jgi:endonuclease/exonuclease/phosphatase (EEP) superfamily protein YafD